MFGGTGWELIEEPGEPPAVREPKTGRLVSIVRRNEFDHLRMTMSVVASDGSAERGFHVFCKGCAALSCDMPDMRRYQSACFRHPRGMQSLPCSCLPVRAS